jgi:alpha/beta superfamily hydrolase
LIVLSFRGSESIRNYFSDLNFALVPLDICDGCQGDAGFWSSWVETREAVSAAVKVVTAAHPNYKIVTTGHSLGGAIATFAAAELRNQGYTVDLVDIVLHGKRKISDTLRSILALLGWATRQQQLTSPIKVTGRTTESPI